MNKRNFLQSQLEALEHCHEGVGTLRHQTLFGNTDFESKLRFFNYTILPPGSSIGYHTHGNDEEVYVILEGSGVMTVDNEIERVAAGDVIVNRCFGSHGLVNDSDKDLRILVFEAEI
jgi:uncharacterized cupin superfamily protein